MDRARRIFVGRIVAIGSAFVLLLLALSIVWMHQAGQTASGWQQKMDAVYQRCRDGGSGPTLCYHQVLNACLSDSRWDHDPFSNPYHECPPVADVASSR